MRSALHLMLESSLIGAVMITPALAQTSPDQPTGRLITVGQGGGTIDTDGSQDVFSLAPGSSQLTVTNSAASKGSSLELSGPTNSVGGLNISGTHTKVIFSGSSATVNGPVTISNSTNSLHFSGGNARINGPVANYGALVFGQSGTATVAGTISGTGKFIQRGPGSTTISGNNSYSGGTLIEQGGTVVVSSDKNLGAPNAPVILNGGTLRTIGDIQPQGVAPLTPPEKLSPTDALNEKELQSLNNTTQAPPPMQVWILSAGGLVGKQISEWGEKAGWHVIWNYKQDWATPTSASFQGSFKSAATRVLQTLADEGAPIHGIFYQGNQTLVVTGSN